MWPTSLGNPVCHTIISFNSNLTLKSSLQKKGKASILKEMPFKQEAKKYTDEKYAPYAFSFLPVYGIAIIFS